MANEAEFQAVFETLKALMLKIAPECVVLEDHPGKYYLALPPIPQIKKDLWLGGVEIKKNYVSYHLIPVYADPSLLEGTSEALKKKMQGKSCFNFKKVDAALFAELDDLTQRGLVSYQAFVAQQAVPD
ncbi:MAG: DUF1801 domain-containing protein [Anaerolineae bacterium]|jgi:hypothetical protein|nr:DUF1801 domain-containing protein [Anaerolineae bacterium]